MANLNAQLTDSPRGTEPGFQPNAAKSRAWIWILLVVLAIGGLVALAIVRAERKNSEASARPAGKAGGRGMAAGGRVPVIVAPVVARDFPVYLTGLGTVTAYNTVAVKTRVEGQIVQINFREGQEVRKGQVLAQIDPRPYEAQLHQAEGNLAKDEATLRDAQANLARYQALFQQQVIAKQQLDTQAAQVGQSQGAIDADRAQIENARLNLTYARITAPISGRAGLRMVDIGNIVHASDPNGLLVITQMHPIAVLFTLPEDAIPQVVGRLKSGKLPVDAFDRDDKNKIASGTLETIDNEIDPTTGTVRLKAIFDNSDEVLWPNQFVNIHLQLKTLPNAIVVPAAAVQHGQQGDYVFTVDDTNTAQMHNVQVQMTQGDVAVIASGVAPGERVVTDGQERLQNGAKVDSTTGQPGGGRGRRSGAQAGGEQPSSNAPQAGQTQPAAPSTQTGPGDTQNRRQQGQHGGQYGQGGNGNRRGPRGNAPGVQP